MKFSRRKFFGTAIGAGALAALPAQATAEPIAAVRKRPAQKSLDITRENLEGFFIDLDVAFPEPNLTKWHGLLK